MPEPLNSQNDENFIAPRPMADDVRDHVRSALSQLARQRTPWRSRMLFAEPADAPRHHELGAPNAFGELRLSKATAYGLGIVPDL